MKRLPDESGLCRATGEIGWIRREAVALIFLELTGSAWQKGSSGFVFSTVERSTFNQT